MRSLGHPFIKIFVLDTSDVRELRPPRGETWFVQKLMVENPFSLVSSTYYQNFIAKVAVTDNTTDPVTVTEVQVGDQILPTASTMVQSKDVNAWTFIDSLHSLRLKRQNTTATVTIAVQCVMTKADPNVLVIPKALYTLAEENHTTWLFTRKPLETKLVGIEDAAFMRQTNLGVLKTIFKKDTVNENADEWVFIKLTDDSDKVVVPLGAV